MTPPTGSNGGTLALPDDTPDNEITPDETPAGANEPSASADEPSPTLRAAWQRGWPIPTTVAGVAILLTGVGYAVSTKPAPDYSPNIARAERLIDREDPRAAIEQLNTQVLPFYGRPSMTPEQRQQFHILMARALFAGQRELAEPQRANDENIRQQYLRALDLGARLEPADVYRLAVTEVALDEPASALQRAAGVSDDHRDLRYGIRKRVVERELGRRFVDDELALRVLSELLADPMLTDDQRAWALVSQADVRDGMDLHDATVARLVREIPRLIGTEEKPSLAGLHLALARAQLAMGGATSARRELDRIDRLGLLAADHPLRARWLLLDAQEKLLTATEPADFEEARRPLLAVVDSFVGTHEYPAALLALVNVAAELDEPSRAMEWAARLLEAVTIPGAPPRPGAQEISEALLERFRFARARGRHAESLGYAELASRAHAGDEQRPAEVIEALAVAHRALGYETLEIEIDPVSGEPLAESSWGLLELAATDPAAQQEARRHLILAASGYRDHADRFVLDDLERYGQSLWQSASLFDRAGDARSAIAGYREIVDSLPNDPRRAEARFRLGRAYQALGEYGAAGTEFRALIDEREGPGTARVGDWAERARVPLAQAFLLDTDPGNDETAEALLRGVLTGNAGGPSRPEFGAALFEFGRLLQKTGRHAEAVERLEEVLSRAVETDRVTAARFALAESRRLLAEGLEDELADAITAAERRRLSNEREQHLRRAEELYESVREDLASMPPHARTPQQNLTLRNASFFLGDCAFELGDTERAMAHYSAARAAYPRDPAVLVAMIQIVNAFLESGDLPSARTANERAKDFYASIPAEAWDDPTLPLSREDWQQWLESSSLLYEQLAGARTDR